MKPEYYENNGQDLIKRFEDGLLTIDETRGFLKGNVYKYITRYQEKNGMEDLQKAKTYLDRLEEFEKNLQPSPATRVFKVLNELFKVR